MKPSSWLMTPLLFAVGCRNALDQRLAIVEQPRVLAIVSEPPEVRPGGQVTLSALVGDRDGTIEPALLWAWCAAPKPPTEDNAVAPGCLGDQVALLGDTPKVTATVPADACRTFGPDVIAAGFRPRDPDPTGGYYQPARADSTIADPAFGFARITCNLANVPSEVAQTYRTEYAPNRNPALEPLAIDGVVNTAEVPRQTEVALVATWPTQAVETYVYYDANTQRITTRREAMRVSWFATAGELSVDASAIGETDAQNSVSTTWKTPDAPGSATLWLVLRDSRGGLATQTIPLIVR